jgi:IS5 family transposase
MRPRLVDMIDMRHELVRLAALIDWSWFEEHWAGFFPSPEGRPALHPRLVAGLMYLQHAYGLSDEAVLARWVENPYFQHFTGETFFQHRPPIHPSSLSRWRSRIGEDGVEWLLTKTIEAGRAAGAVTERSLSQVVVDTTVMEKAIAHPRTHSSTRRRAAPSSPWPARPGSGCGRTTIGKPRGGPPRPGASPMPGSSGACARRCGR